MISTDRRHNSDKWPSPWPGSRTWRSGTVWALMMVFGFVGTLFLSACGGGGGGSSSGGGGGDNSVVNSLSSYVMPSELSAVPASESRDQQVTPRSVLRALFRTYTDENSDYSKAKTRKYVEERSLEQFDVLEDVLTALNQTHYYDEIGNGAYRAMVIQVGDEGGQQQKSLAPWVVKADIIDADGDIVSPDDAVEGQDYDVQVLAWIEEGDQIVKGKFIISDPPTQNEDGSYADYGEWQITANFESDSGGDTGEGFAATCERGTTGQSIIRLHEAHSEGPPEMGDLSAEVAAVMYRSEDEGYGKVRYPDWEAMYGEGGPIEGLTEVPTEDALYAYNNAYLGVSVDGDDPVYKQRGEVVEMTHQYGVFKASNGRDLQRDKQFGFPIRYDDNGTTRHGYYGAWQGRHQLWLNGSDDGEVDLATLEGTEVTREDWNPDSEPQTYTIGPTFDGVLAMRTYATASLDDIQNIPVEIWVNQDYQLLYESGTWWYCPNVEWTMDGPTCAGTPVDFGTEIGWNTLVKGANDNRKWVNIDGWDNNTQQNKRFVYLPDSNSYGVDAGLYEAEEVFGDNGSSMVPTTTPPTPLDTANVTQLWVWVSGSIYVMYDGSGWVEKELVDFDEETWTPEFGGNDMDYTLPEGRELYINMQGANYVVRKDGDVTSVLLELQTAANPSNTLTGGEMADVGDYVLKEPWAENNSTYRFDIDPTSDTYLMLVYNTVGDNDTDQNGDPEVSEGDVVERDIWGIEAYVDDTPVVGDDDRPVAFNWEYDSGEGDWGAVTYLMDGDDYLILDDPVRFEPFEVELADSTVKTLALQFDGWMCGLPDLYRDLERNDWVMTTDISEKIINLPAGTALTDVATGIEYVLKPLEVSQFLLPAEAGTDTGLDDLLGDAEDVDISDVPDFTDNNMGDTPTGTELLYSEGKPVE